MIDYVGLMLLLRFAFLESVVCLITLGPFDGDSLFRSIVCLASGQRGVGAGVVDHAILL